jgi:hypothetical protein
MFLAAVGISYTLSRALPLEQLGSGVPTPTGGLRHRGGSPLFSISTLFSRKYQSSIRNPLASSHSVHAHMHIHSMFAYSRALVTPSGCGYNLGRNHADVHVRAQYTYKHYIHWVCVRYLAYEYISLVFHTSTQSNTHFLLPFGRCT